MLFFYNNPYVVTYLQGQGQFHPSEMWPKYTGKPQQLTMLIGKSAN